MLYQKLFWSKSIGAAVGWKNPEKHLVPRDGADLFFNLRPADQVYKAGPKIKVLERFESCGLVKAISGGVCEALGNGPLPVRHTCAFNGSGRNVAYSYFWEVESHRENYCNKRELRIKLTRFFKKNHVWLRGDVIRWIQLLQTCEELTKWFISENGTG